MWTTSAMSLEQQCKPAIPDNDSTDEDNNGSDCQMCNGHFDKLTSGGRPLSPGASYIIIKTDLPNYERLEDFDQEPIASGFFSEVYKVIHRTTREVMVLKKNVQVFNRSNVLNEIQLLNQLHHPNIIKFLGVCIHEGQLHALTEYINRGSLRQLICDDDTTFPWPVRLGIAQDIADGMSYLHRLRIVHRDLTSLNCLIRKKGPNLSAIVSDLGLAIKLPENHGRAAFMTITSEGILQEEVDLYCGCHLIPMSRNSEEKLSIVGSPFWMAPECLHGKPYNETADIFSYGIILCEMIGRITADPEDLPRLHNFGLDEVSFTAMISTTSCPEAFLQLAYNCCEMTPTIRVAFKNIIIKIENIATELNSNNNLKSSEGCTHLKKSRSQSIVQPPRLNFYNITTSHRQHKTKLKRSNSDSGPRHVIGVRASVNPFDTPDLQGGRVKLWNSSIDTRHCSYELETLDDVSLLLMQGCREALSPEKRNRMKKRISQSLPSSPEMNRKIKQDEENTFAEELEDQEFEDTFLQDEVVDLTQAPKRRSLLTRDYSLPSQWREELHKPRSRSADNFSRRLDSGVSSFGDDDLDVIDRIDHLEIDDRK